MIEAMKQAYQLLLTEPHAPTVCDQLEVFFRRAIAELESQEPVATVTSETGADITMSWWHEPALPVGTKLFTHPPQRTEQNYCPRCGKRTNDIHTCTPPRENA
jgi:hypothetical protein